MEVVANKNCAGIIAGSRACERETGVLCTNPRPPPPSLHEKTLCDHQFFSAIAAAESKKAAAEKDARLVCRPKMSEPACVPPEAAASVDNLLAMWHALSRVKDDLSLLAQMTEEPMRAAFKSYEAPMPDECADAQLAPQGRAWHVGVPPEAAASDDNLLAMRDDAVSRVYIVLWELQELLLAQMIKEPMHAAFGSYDA